MVDGQRRQFYVCVGFFQSFIRIDRLSANWICVASAVRWNKWQFFCFPLLQMPSNEWRFGDFQSNIDGGQPITFDSIIYRIPDSS